MNTKQITILAAIGMVTFAGAILLLSDVLNMYQADAKESSRLSTGFPGHGSKIVVEIDSPFGFERIYSFKTFNTDNLMHENGFHTLKLQGTIMNDKRLLLYWIARDLGSLPDGMATRVETHGAKAISMTSAKKDSTTDKVPMTGTVRLEVLDGRVDIYNFKALRMLEFSGCHVAGYHLGTLHDNDRPYLEDQRWEHYEQVDFACKSVTEIKNKQSNNREFMVERPINNDTKGPIMNEKGELITTREYRQPIVMNGNGEIEQEREPVRVGKEIFTTITTDEKQYKVGEAAVFTVRFIDTESVPLDPDLIRVYYNDRMVELEQQEPGVYTFETQPLEKEHQQLIVSAEKKGFPTDTTYLSIPIHRIG